MRTAIAMLAAALLLLSAGASFAQGDFAIYHCSLAADSVLKLEVSAEKEGQFKLWINTDPKGGISISQKQYPDFVQALKDAKLKYQEWTKKAKNHKVTDQTKKMALKAKGEGFFVYGSEWHFAYDINLRFGFIVRDYQGKLYHLMFVDTGALIASDNEFMKVDSKQIIFTSSKEIQQFINTIAIEKIEAFFKASQKEDLFKN
jgi:hypothetical protein